MLAVVTSALAFQAPLMAPSRPAAASRTSMVQATVFDDGMSQFKADYPWLAKYGFGPTVKAERWNGRHAMSPRALARTVTILEAATDTAASTCWQDKFGCDNVKVRCTCLLDILCISKCILGFS